MKRARITIDLSGDFEMDMSDEDFAKLLEKRLESGDDDGTLDAEELPDGWVHEALAQITGQVAEISLVEETEEEA